MNIILTLVTCTLFAASTVSGYRSIGRVRGPYTRGHFVIDTIILGALAVAVIIFVLGV